MPLFPAYATDGTDDIGDIVVTGSQGTVWEATESREAQLLASDTDDEAQAARAPPPAQRDNFYLDCKLDRGNLCVSTLYYPGRPQYERGGRVPANGAGGTGRGARGARRYWARRVPDAPDAPAAAERAAAYQDLLLKQPQNVLLWEQYIDFQETCGGAAAALAAAEQAAERAPRSQRLRARLLAAARAALPRAALLQRLRDLLAAEKCSRRRAELWGALVEAAGAAEGAGAARAALVVALADTRAHAPAYPRLLHAYGAFLRAAGLWEELVLLLELAGGMAGALPPAPPAPAQPPDVEQRLRAAEERALASGLPLPAVWVRVERARAAAHWRPARIADLAELAADPQRAPAAHEHAELLRPLVGAPHALLLSVTLLRLAKVPLFPGAGPAARAWGAAPADCAEALLPLLRAARRLPAAHPARPAPPAARRLLAALLDPPHYFTDDHGFLSWVRWLWDACCETARGERRAALLCWRMRWLHALLPLAEGCEAARLRDEARAALQRFTADGACGAAAALAFAQFARVELAAGSPGRAARVAERALRAALLDPAAPQHYALYVARVVCEVSARGAAGALGAAGARALVAAAGGCAPHADEPPPGADELRAALDACERRCDELERRYAADERGGEADGGAEDEAAECLAALLPGEAEWGAARALLAPPERRVRLLRALPAQAARCEGGEAAHYYEQSACALLCAGAGEHGAEARELARLFPHNAYLALAGAGVPLWAWRRAAGVEPSGVPAAPRSACAALAAALPAMLRAESAAWAPPEAEACARAVRRVVGAGAGASAGGALLGALRLRAEERAPHPRLLPALYDALDRTPHDKWLHVRGAACCGGEAAALHDALLDKQLRAHALLDELAALAPPAPPPPLQ